MNIFRVKSRRKYDVHAIHEVEFTFLELQHPKYTIRILRMRGCACACVVRSLSDREDVVVCALG